MRLEYVAVIKDYYSGAVLADATDPGVVADSSKTAFFAGLEFTHTMYEPKALKVGSATVTLRSLLDRESQFLRGLYRKFVRPGTNDALPGMRLEIYRAGGYGTGDMPLWAGFCQPDGLTGAPDSLRLAFVESIGQLKWGLITKGRDFNDTPQNLLPYAIARPTPVASDTFSAYALDSTKWTVSGGTVAPLLDGAKVGQNPTTSTATQIQSVATQTYQVGDQLSVSFDFYLQRDPNQSERDYHGGVAGRYEPEIFAYLIANANGSTGVKLTSNAGWLIVQVLGSGSNPLLSQLLLPPIQYGTLLHDQVTMNCLFTSSGQYLTITVAGVTVFDNLDSSWVAAGDSSPCSMKLRFDTIDEWLATQVQPTSGIVNSLNNYRSTVLRPAFNTGSQVFSSTDLLTFISNNESQDQFLAYLADADGAEFRVRYSSWPTLDYLDWGPVGSLGKKITRIPAMNTIPPTSSGIPQAIAFPVSDADHSQDDQFSDLVIQIGSNVSALPTLEPSVLPYANSQIVVGAHSQVAQEEARSEAYADWATMPVVQVYNSDDRVSDFFLLKSFASGYLSQRQSALKSMRVQITEIPDTAYRWREGDSLYVSMPEFINPLSAFFRVMEAKFVHGASTVDVVLGRLYWDDAAAQRRFYEDIRLEQLYQSAGTVPDTWMDPNAPYTLAPYQNTSLLTGPDCGPVWTFNIDASVLTSAQLRIVQTASAVLDVYLNGLLLTLPVPSTRTWTSYVAQLYPALAAAQGTSLSLQLKNKSNVPTTIDMAALQLMAR